MKEYDFLEAWQDFVGIFGPGVAPRLEPLGSKLWTIVRLPSRTGWMWKRVKAKRASSKLRVFVTLNDRANDLAQSKS